MYAVIPYATAMGATEIPWALAQTLLFSCIAYFMIHFDFTAGELPHLEHPIAKPNEPLELQSCLKPVSAPISAQFMHLTGHQHLVQAERR